MSGRETSPFARSVLAGLETKPKRFESKYLYDERGSELFEEICELDAYYPTRTEISLLEKVRHEIAEQAGPGVAVVEPGSGAGIKVRLLLDALEDPAAYVPADISPDYLRASEERLREDYPDLPICPLLVDFTEPFELPEEVTEHPRLLFFPGSTIGNFEPDQARQFMERMRSSVEPSAFVIGVDLVKDEDTLLHAYDDPEGVTAAFNLNLLDRVNRELNAAIDVDAFRHEARWNRTHQRIEMHLVSRRQHTVEVLGHAFEFEEGESIHTECSYKYSIETFARLARSAGWQQRASWTDADRLFSLHLLEPNLNGH
jgi:L-histidine Nalpha-methyltransferase